MKTKKGVYPMSNSEKIDRRVIKTKKAIRAALVKLLSENALSDISITNIAEEADIHRKTFYSYYDSVYKVVDEIEDEIVSTFESIIKNVDLKKDLKNIDKIFESLTKLIEKDFEFYSHLMRTENAKNLHLISKIATSLKSKMKESLPKSLFHSRSAFEIMINFIISGMMSVYQEWFEDPTVISIEELSKQMSLMTFSSLNGLIGETENE